MTILFKAAATAAPSRKHIIKTSQPQVKGTKYRHKLLLLLRINDDLHASGFDLSLLPAFGADINDLMVV